jgi:oligoribonuclease (3'-5' exoribonuclease)
MDILKPHYRYCYVSAVWKLCAEFSPAIYPLELK